MVKEALENKSRGIKHLYPIVEVACASSPQHLFEVRRAYFSIYSCSLEEDIGSVLAIPLPIRKVNYSIMLLHSSFDSPVVPGKPFSMQLIASAGSCGTGELLQV